MATIGELKVAIGADTTGFEQGMKDVQRAIKPMAQRMQRVGRSLTQYVTLPLTALATATVGAQVQFEEAFAGVRKTVDASAQEFEMLSEGIRDMSQEMPIAATEIAGVAESAGQLGIETDNILSFTETMVGMGVATNMASREAATSLARLANIMQMPQDEFDRLGSTIVGLGNNMATTEQEISEMAQRLAGAGNQVGLTEAQVVSLAASMSELGIRAQMGGTSMSRAFLSMNTAVLSGSEALEEFASIAGMTTEDFAQQFEEDAAAAMVSFIEGLQRIQEEGGDVASAMGRVDLSGRRVQDVFGRLAGAGDGLSDALEDGNRLWEENSALTEEVERKFETLGSQLSILWNRVKDIAVSIGAGLEPVVRDLIDALDPFLSGIEDLASGFQDLSPTMQRVIAGVGALAAAAGPVLVTLGALSSAVLPAVIAGFSALTGPVGIAAAALAGGAALVLTNWQDVVDFFKTGEGAEISDAIKKTWNESKGYVTTAIEEIIEAVESLNEAFSEVGTESQLMNKMISRAVQGILGILRANIRTATNIIRTFVGAIGDMVSAVTALLRGDFAGAWNETIDLVERAVTAIVRFVTNMGTAILSTVETITSVVPKVGDAVGEARRRMEEIASTFQADFGMDIGGGPMVQMAEEGTRGAAMQWWTEAGQMMEQLGQKTEETADATDDNTDSQNDNADATNAAAEAYQNLTNRMAEFSGEMANMNLGQEMEDLSDQIERFSLGQEMQELSDSLAEMPQELEERSLDSIRAVEDALAQLNQAFREAETEAERTSIGDRIQELEKLRNEMQKAAEDTDEMGDGFLDMQRVVESALEGMSRAMADMALGLVGIGDRIDSVGDAFEALGNVAVQAIREIIADLIKAQVKALVLGDTMKGISNVLSGLTGGGGGGLLGGLLGGLIGGGGGGGGLPGGGMAPTPDIPMGPPGMRFSTSRAGMFRPATRPAMQVEVGVRDFVVEGDKLVAVTDAARVRKNRVGR